MATSGQIRLTQELARAQASDYRLQWTTELRARDGRWIKVQGAGDWDHFWSRAATCCRSREPWSGSLPVDLRRRVPCIRRVEET